MSLKSDDIILIDIDFVSVTFELSKILSIDEILAQKIVEAERSGKLVDVETYYYSEMEEEIKKIIKKPRTD